MPSVELDLTSLTQAYAELVDALKYYNSPLAQTDKNLQRHLMSGTIQAFEFTYELVIKFIRRYLELTEPSRETIVSMTFPTLIRTANARGLLITTDITIWKQFRDARNITSHTYDKIKANEVMSVIPLFIDACKQFIDTLGKRIKSS